MEKQTVIVLIATRSTPLVDGLDALLKTIPQIDEVVVTRSLEIALQQIETREPRIALLDLALLKNEPEASLQKMMALSPQTHRVLMVEDVKHVQLMPQYAEAILIKGISPAAITTILINLLVSKGNGNERIGWND